MCGIIGIYNEQHNIVPTLIASLSHLEYRGYDSAGIAFLDKFDRINCHKMGGRVAQLEQKVAPMQLESHIGIGHTRWATHGVPNWQNAHPIFNEKLAIVHNGVIENYEELKDCLVHEGYVFRTDTDTEVLLALISKHLNNGLKPKDAVLSSICQVEGSFAVVAIFGGYRKLMIGAKMRSPLLFGYSDGTYAVSSDVYALPANIKQYAALGDKEMVVISADGAKVYGFSKILLEKTFIPMPCFSQNIFQKNNSAHFMLKEIEEQPEALSSIIQSLYDKLSGTIKFEHLNSIAAQTKRLRIIACGSSYFAGFISRHWFESMAKIPVSIELASEFCYKNFIAEENELFLFISQSGETADTIAALKKLKDLNIPNLVAIVNVPNSTITKEAQYLIQTSVGPEIGVAATKSFTAQLLVLGLLALFIALHKNTILPLAYNSALSAIIELPLIVRETLSNMPCLDSIATLLSQSNSMVFSGRNIFYGIALEGALKMKEISYLHAEAIPAGELKHGSMALVANNYPMLFINPYNDLFYKTMSNMQEVYVRGAKIIGITNKQGSKLMGKICHKLIILPDAHEIVSPIIFSIAMQLVAYKTALLLGCDIDKPRNLAKSVTVE